MKTFVASFQLQTMVYQYRSEDTLRPLRLRFHLCGRKTTATLVEVSVMNYLKCSTLESSVLDPRGWQSAMPEP